MPNLKELTVSEYLGDISEVGDPRVEGTPQESFGPFRLPFVPYDANIKTGPSFEDPNRMGRVEANPRKNPAFPSFALSALGRGAPESLETEMSIPQVPGRLLKGQLRGEFGPRVDMSSVDVGVGPLHLFGSRGTRGGDLPPGQTPPEQITVGAGARGNLPGGLGELSGSYEKISVRPPTEGPRFTLEDFRARWGALSGGPVQASLEAGATFPKFGQTRLPNQYNVSARATAENPFGIGGRLSGDASANLRPGNDDYRFGARYTVPLPLPFGGRR